MLRKRKDNINNKLNRLLDSYLNEIISKENFIDKKKELETESKEVSELIDELEKRTGHKIIGNKSASGTEILKELGEELPKSLK